MTLYWDFVRPFVLNKGMFVQIQKNNNLRFFLNFKDEIIKFQKVNNSVQYALKQNKR